MVVVMNLNTTNLGDLGGGWREKTQMNTLIHQQIVTVGSAGENK